MKLPFLATVSSALLAAAQPAGAQATAETPLGRLAGKTLGDGTRMFLGVPYALPPVGEARWRPPVPVPAWSGTRDATAFGAACIQPKTPVASIYTDDPETMSEDCLSLNIWSPKGSHKAPVMVWIHGGALLTGHGGSPFYDGARLAQEGVVVVTINYRLGVFGFLAHPELSAESPHGASGNYGLLDQIEALKWVRGNIASLGGDPDNVTIFGESAGALSVMYLLASPLAKGLYSKAIAESPYMVPTPLLRAPAFGIAPAEQIGLAVAAAVNAPDLKALRAVDAATLNAVPVQGGPIPQATVDGWFLTEQLVDTFDKGTQAPVPLLAGFNSGEIRTLPGLMPPVPASAEAYEAMAREQYGQLADKFLTLYPATDPTESLLAATRDKVYGWSSQRLARKQTTLGLPAYLYYFDHGYPAAEALKVKAFHASEIPYVFGGFADAKKLPAAWPKPPVDKAEKALSDAMISYWTTFARNGVPTAPGQPAWQPYGASARYMAFRAHPEAGAALLPGHYELVEEVACRRRAADESWMPMVGKAAPAVPAAPAPCAASAPARK